MLKSKKHDRNRVFYIVITAVKLIADCLNNRLNLFNKVSNDYLSISAVQD